MKLRILRRAVGHLSDGSRFYERQTPGLGNYFRQCLIDDIERLKVTAGVHEIVPEGFYRAISGRFPFAIYYLLEREEIIVSAVLDSRRNPEWIKRQLR